MYPDRMLRWSQHGGGAEYYEITVDEKPILVRRTMDGNTLYIVGGPDQNSSPCFELHIDRKTRHAHLQDVKRRNRCFTSGAITVGRTLVRAAYRLAKEHDAVQLELTDNSTIDCPESVQLSNLSFLTTGRTWYESIIPDLEGICCQSEIEEARERVRTNTWTKVGADLIDLDLSDTDIDPHAAGSAMRVLSLMKVDKRFCWFFHKHMKSLLMRSGIHSLHGTHWWCPLSPAPDGQRRRFSLRPPSTDTQRHTRKRIATSQQ
jgi:hypothetical protein